MEYWVLIAILAIVVDVGKPLSLDEFTDLSRKMGYACVRVKIDVGKPLKLGVLIRGRKEAFWQQFIYENLLMICYQCGRLGRSDDIYHFTEVEPLSDTNDGSLLPENVVAVGGIPARRLRHPWWRRQRGLIGVVILDLAHG